MNTIRDKTTSSQNQILTRRELEVLWHIAHEKCNDQIAKELFISQGTVDTHRRNILNKLNVQNTAGMIRYAFELQLLVVTDGYTRCPYLM